MQRTDMLLKTSRLFIGLIGLMSGISLCLIAFCLQMGWWVKIVLIISVLGYGGWIVWSIGLMKSARSIIGLQLLGDGTCYLQYPSGTMEAKMMGDSTVTSMICVLRFKVPDRRWKTSCVVFRDSLSREMYWKLLVWLRCFGATQLAIPSKIR